MKYKDEFKFGKFEHNSKDIEWKVFRASSAAIGGHGGYVIAVSKYPVACTIGTSLKETIAKAIIDKKDVHHAIIESANKCLVENFFNLQEQEALYEAKKELDGKSSDKDCFRFASAKALMELIDLDDIGKFPDGNAYDVFIQATKNNYTFFNSKTKEFEIKDYPTDGSFEETEFCIYSAIILKNE